MSIKLRSPNIEEFLRIAEFSFDNFVNEAAKYTSKTPAELKSNLGGPPTKISSNDLWFLIEKDNQQIGFVWIQLRPEAGAAFGYDIFLEPQFRSLGIGRKVMVECGKKLTSMDIETIEICVFEKNEIARGLYSSLGFTEKKFDERLRQYTLFLNLRHYFNLSIQNT